MCSGAWTAVAECCDLNCSIKAFARSFLSPVTPANLVLDSCAVGAMGTLTWIQENDPAPYFKELKPAINGILTIAITAFAWHRCVSAQVEHKSTSKDGSMSANASCYEKSTGRLVGSNKSVTSVLTSPDGLYRAYAESEAVASRSPSAANAECQNTSKLFVSGPKGEKFRPVLVVEPSPEALGNSIALVDWSPHGSRFLAVGF